MIVPTLAGDRASELAAIFSDPVAFRHWYEAAVSRVYGYLHGRCAGDTALAEELTQQTFVQAVRRRETFDGRSDSITWLISIARNKLTDHYRRLDREERRHLRLVVREIAAHSADRPWAEGKRREEVLAALGSLPAAQRAAIVLHYIDGLSVREVARSIGRSESATESLLTRARERFRTVYQEAPDD